MYAIWLSLSVNIDVDWELNLSFCCEYWWIFYLLHQRRCFK